MAQMPIQSMSGRADLYQAARPPTLAARPAMAIPRASHAFESGRISGGPLRPGAVDQELFKAYLAAARKEAAAAPPAPPGAPALPGVPSLSSAQLAALGLDVGGVVEAPAGSELVIDIPAPNPADPGTGVPSRPDQALPQGAPGAATAPLFSPAPGAPATEATPGTAAPAAAEVAPGPAGATDAPQAPPSAAPASQASAERGPIPGSRRGADGAWELPRLPNKDERDMLRGQKWRVVETEAARQLFLGPDGEFGWDDFVDLINPLQHIPLVNIAYRAITGDEIYGAARMIDAAFGPLAGISTAIDLAFRDLTGKSMAGNAIAALFGPGEAPAGEVGSINTASADRTQLADRALFRRGSNR
jgi:hypothetical protein